MDLDIYKIMEEIHNDISSGALIFANENQFQFELAWRIKEKYEKYDVLFEVVYLDDNNEKKNYTDLVIVDNIDKKYIAIELKYKTKQRDRNDLLLKNQGAQDLGVYDFLKDLSRIEKLKSSDEKQFRLYNKYDGFIFEKGYAVILTNDKTYYEGGREEKYAMNFSIKNNSIMCGEMDWRRDLGSCVEKTFRNAPINLSGKYVCKWLPEINNNLKKDFYYLILEVV